MIDTSVKTFVSSANGSAVGGKKYSQNPPGTAYRFAPTGRFVDGVLVRDDAIPTIEVFPFGLATVPYLSDPLGGTNIIHTGLIHASIIPGFTVGVPISGANIVHTDQTHEASQVPNYTSSILA